MSISKETWQLWRDAGLKTFRVGTDAEFVLTDDLHCFIASMPVLGERPSAKRRFKRNGGAA